MYATEVQVLWSSDSQQSVLVRNITVLETAYLHEASALNELDYHAHGLWAGLTRAGILNLFYLLLIIVLYTVYTTAHHDIYITYHRFDEVIVPNSSRRIEGVSWRLSSRL